MKAEIQINYYLFPIFLPLIQSSFFNGIFHKCLSFPVPLLIDQSLFTLEATGCSKVIHGLSYSLQSSLVTEHWFTSSHAGREKEQTDQWILLKESSFLQLKNSHLVTKGNFTSGGEHKMKYTYDILLDCSLETYMILLTNVTSIILI